MAGDLNLTPLLVGLGVDKLSVGTHQLPKIKKAIRSLTYSDCQSIAKAALNARYSAEILSGSEDMARRCYGSIMD